MAHELASASDMAFVGDTPWHGLGNKLPKNQPIEVWQKAAGMDFEIKQTDVLYNAATNDGNLLNLRSNPDSTVLYRSDNYKALSVVSKRYKVVQPRDVLSFYRDLVAVGGYEISTAGVLKGGRKMWALADTGQQATLKGDDKLKNYLLLATSCDSSLATTAQFTSIRVVCNNTLQLAIGDSKGAVKVSHSTTFNPIEVKRALGLGISSWDLFMDSIKAMSERHCNKFEAMSYLVNVLGDPDMPLSEQPNQKALQSVYGLFAGGGKGADLESSNQTVWGLLNAVTEHIDHHRRAMSSDHRLDSAWFGMGAQIKEKAFTEALKLAA